MFFSKVADRGFSLMELMVVLGVITIMSAIALPRVVEWRENARLKSAARDLYSSLQKARLLAVKTNREYAIEFDTNLNSYTLVNSGDDRDYSQKTDNQPEQTVYLNSYGSGVKYGHKPATKEATVSAGTFGGNTADNVSHINNVVVFNSRGMLNNTGYIYLNNNAESLSYAVGTPQVSGGLVLKKWGGSDWH